MNQCFMPIATVCSLLLHDSVMPSWHCLMAITYPVFHSSIFFLACVILYGPCFMLLFLVAA